MRLGYQHDQVLVRTLFWIVDYQVLIVSLLGFWLLYHH